MLAYSCLRGPPRLLVLLRWPYRPLSRILLRFRLSLLSIVGPPLALTMVVGQPWTLTLSSGLGWHACYSTGLRWPSCCYTFIRWTSGSFCGSGASSGVGLRGPQPVALRCLNVRRPDLPPFLIVFPSGFRLSTPGCMFGLRLYIAIRRLYWLFCPVRGDAVRSPLPRCHGVRVYVLHGEGYGLLLGVPTLALCFFWFIVLCVSQPKMSRGVVLYGHRKCRLPWVPLEFILALSRTLSLGSGL